MSTRRPVGAVGAIRRPICLCLFVSVVSCHQLSHSAANRHFSCFSTANLLILLSSEGMFYSGNLGVLPGKWPQGTEVEGRVMQVRLTGAVLQQLLDSTHRV